MYVVCNVHLCMYVVREPESYEALSLSLSDIINEVEVLGKEGICIGGYRP